ncbi:MAG: rhomboid family intramembrane serine protease [bacterium]
MYYRRGSNQISMVAWLILINVTVFILQQPFGDVMIYYFSLIPSFVTKKMFVWQFFTHMFMHGNLPHLFFNMFSLFIFGVSLEQLWGPKRFLSYYIVSGLGGGILHYLINVNSVIPSIGASGAVYGVLLAYGLTFPETVLYLNFFFPVKAKYAVIIFGVTELFFGLTNARSGIAHFAHLGGLIAGFIYLRFEYKIFRQISKVKDTKVYKSFEEMNFQRKKERLDLLLDKISKIGYTNLSEDEKSELDILSRWFRDNG